MLVDGVALRCTIGNLPQGRYLILRFLADENFPGPAIRRLRADGHDVVAVAEECSGAKDEYVLERANQEDRIVLTFDKDFGELVRRSEITVSTGIILFRLRTSPSNVAQKLVEVITAREDWRGYFSVVDDAAIRQTKLPNSE